MGARAQSLLLLLQLLPVPTPASPTPSLHLAVPCFNEELRLPVEQYADYAAAHPRTHFTFVDDGSTDGTLPLLRGLAARHPEQLHVLPLPSNVGKAEATRAGLRAATASGAAVVGFWDADLATPLGAVDDFEATMAADEQLEMVFGARVALLGRRIDRLPSRHYLGRIFATLASSVLSLRIYDTQCGAKLFKATPALERVIAEPFGSRWIFDVELIARLIALRRADTAARPVSEVIYEFPLHEWRDIRGSKVGFVDKLQALWGLVDIYSRYFSPWASWPPAGTAPAQHAEL